MFGASLPTFLAVSSGCLSKRLCVSAPPRLCVNSLALFLAGIPSQACPASRVSPFIREARHFISSASFGVMASAQIW